GRRWARSLVYGARGSISGRSRLRRPRRRTRLAGDPPRPRPLMSRTPRSLRSPSPERQVAFRVGISAESRAAALLIAKGFRILARRFRSPVGEIDIVARRRHLL